MAELGTTEEPWAKVPSMLPTPGAGFERGTPTAPKQSLEWTPQQRAEQMAGGSLGAEPPMMGVPVAKTAPTVSVSAPANRVPVYENSVVQGRATLNNPVTGPITAAAAAPPAGISRGGTMPAPMVGEGPIAGSAGQTDPMVAIRNELAQRRAAEDMGQQQKIQAMQANANWASNWTAQRDAASNARLANWNAEMARTDLAGNIGGPGRDEAARLATLTAAGANNQLATADANLQKSQAGLTGAPRNYIDEFGKLQTADKERTNAESLKTTAGARLIEANARATEAGAKAGLEKEQTAGVKLSNEQHQKILDIATKMGSAKTPAEARALERQALVLAGKSGKDWKAERMGGEVRVDPVSGMPAGKDPDSVLLYNEQTGEQIVIGPQGASTANAASQRKDGDRQKDANGNIREWRNGKWTEVK